MALFLICWMLWVYILWLIWTCRSRAEKACIVDGALPLRDLRVCLLLVARSSGPVTALSSAMQGLAWRPPL